MNPAQFKSFSVTDFKRDLKKTLAIFDSLGAKTDTVVIEKCVVCQNLCRVAGSKKVCLSCFMKPGFDRANVPQEIRDEMISAAAEVMFQVEKQGLN